MARVDNVYGDRNLFCSCIPLAEVADARMTIRHPLRLMRILVLGAGVVGVTAAWYLAQDGHDVTVVDRHPGAGARDVVRERRPDLGVVRGAVGESRVRR